MERTATMPSLKIIFSTRTNIWLITSVILLLNLMIVTSQSIEQLQQQQQVGEGDSTSGVEVEGGNNGNFQPWEDQQKPNMPAIIVNEVQESPQTSLNDAPAFRHFSNEISSQDNENESNEIQRKTNNDDEEESLETRESRRNVVGIPNDNENEVDEYGRQYNGIILPQGVQLFTPYTFINNHHQQPILFQPNQPSHHQTIAAALPALQNGYLDHRNNVQQPVNLIFAPQATVKRVQQPAAVILQELRSLQFHDKSPLMNVLFQPSNVNFNSNLNSPTTSSSWPSKYQARKYLPPQSSLSHLFVRSSPYYNPFEPASSAVTRQYSVSYENNHQNDGLQFIPQTFNNFIGSSQSSPSQFHHQHLYNQHQYVIPQVPFFSSNVPISRNFPPLPYVSPSLRGYKTETPGDIDVRMSNISDDISQQPQIVDLENGLKNRAELDGDKNLENSQDFMVEQREAEVGGDDVNDVENITKVDFNDVNQPEDIEETSTPASVLVVSQINEEENLTATLTPVEKNVTTIEQSDENLIDVTTQSPELLITTTENSQTEEEVSNLNSMSDDEIAAATTTTTMNSSAADDDSTTIFTTDQPSEPTTTTMTMISK